MNKIETILSPALYPFRKMNGSHICVVIDILRATTSICTAVNNGAKAIIPVKTIEEAKEYKEKVKKQGTKQETTHKSSANNFITTNLSRNRKNHLSS